MVSNVVSNVAELKKQCALNTKGRQFDLEPKGGCGWEDNMRLNRRDFLGSIAKSSALVLVPGFLGACAHQGAPLAPLEPIGPSTSTSNTWFREHFGIDERVLQRVMERALSRGGDFCDLYFEHSIDHSIRLEDGAVNSARSAVELGVGIRVVQGTRFGYAFTEELTLESMLKAAETASTVASGAPGKAPERFQVPARSNYYPIETHWDTLGIDARIPLLTGINQRMLAADKRIIKANIGFYDAVKRILVVTSDGTLVEDFQPMAMMSASCVAEQGGRRERNSHALGGRHGLAYYTPARQEELATVAVSRAVALFDAVKPPAGEYPLVLGPGPSGILLHEAIGHGIEADFNRKNISIFADKLGKSIAIPEVTIIDSATHSNTRGAINVDDEGNPGQHTVLVEKGILSSYLHDRISSLHYKVASTGSGRRESFRFNPLPRMRNTYMENGSENPEDIIRSVKRGIYAEAFTNGQVRIGEGSFSFYISSGRMIEDGKLTSPIKDVNIVGNGPEVLARISRVGNDLAIDQGGWTCGKDGQSVPVSQGMPTTLVSSITIGGSRS